VAFVYYRNRCNAEQLYLNYLQGEILLKNSRKKDGKAGIAHKTDWIQVTFGFDVTELC
jgi:hypothetical protein